MITFPGSYPVNPQNFSQGPTRAWYAPYSAGGADPATMSIVALGALDKGGLEFDHKLTYSEGEARSIDDLCRLKTLFRRSRSLISN